MCYATWNFDGESSCYPSLIQAVSISERLSGSYPIVSGSLPFLPLPLNTTQTQILTPTPLYDGCRLHHAILVHHTSAPRLRRGLQLVQSERGSTRQLHKVRQLQGPSEETP